MLDGIWMRMLILNFEVKVVWKFFYGWLFSIWVLFLVRWMLFFWIVFSNFFFVFFVLCELMLIIWILFELLYWLCIKIVCMFFCFKRLFMIFDIDGIFKIFVMFGGSLMVFLIIFVKNVNILVCILFRRFLGLFKYSVLLFRLIDIFRCCCLFWNFW